MATTSRLAVVRTPPDDERGPPHQFEDWYRAEHARLLVVLTVALGSGEIAREALAEASARALQRWDRVGLLQSPSGWVYRTGYNAGRRANRRASLERQIWRRLPAPAAQPPAPVPHPELWDAVLRLPPRQRQAVALRYVADLQEAEIAARMAVAPGTVAATLSKARAALRSALPRDPEPSDGT